MRAILMYHSVDGSGSAISIDEAAFRAHVAWLASGAVRVVPLGAITEGNRDDDVVALTFDDAFRSFAEVAWPLLRERALPVTLFAVSEHAGGTNAWGGRDAAGIPTLPLMEWDELGLAAEQGVAIGAHTRTHPDLRTVDAARLADELAGSAEAIAARTGHRPTQFAYPFGGVDDRVAGAAASVFAAAYTTELRALAPDEDHLRLPRLDAYYFKDAGRLASWGSPAFRGYLRLRAGLRQARAVLTRGAR